MGIAAGLMALGTGISAFGQYQAGEESAAVAKYNQQVKEREAQAAEQQAMIESRRQAQAASRKMSELRAQIGASGIVGTTGAPISILTEQARQSELENLGIGYEGIQEAEKLRAEGRMIRREGRAARRASRIGAGATLLSGFSTAYSMV